MEWKRVLEHNLRYNIQANNAFKPFNDDFDYNLIKKYVSESKPLTPEESILFELLPKFHDVYVIYYSYLKALHEEYHLKSLVVRCVSGCRPTTKASGKTSAWM